MLWSVSQSVSQSVIHSLTHSIVMITFLRVSVSGKDNSFVMRMCGPPEQYVFLPKHVVGEAVKCIRGERQRDRASIAIVVLERSVSTCKLFTRCEAILLRSASISP